ncbi:MAG: hypothetical protein HYY42_03280 [Chloroflexi bacterium]|nr:hypothetical protein [Chloroflexota bacterium]
MTGRSDARPMVIMVGVAMLFAGALYGWVLGILPVGPSASAPAVVATATPTASPTARPPEVKISHETCCKQSARFLNATWSSTEKVTAATFALEPPPPFGCSATIDPTGLKGTFGCVGLLRGATDLTGKLTVTTAAGTFPVDHKFKTMGDRLESVQWFTEFEDPKGEPLACAAASCRIIQNYTTGQDKMTATQILEAARQFNKSNDPGIDPVAIATILKRLDARNSYHYYRFNTRDEATAAAVYWLFRSGKPVMAITLAGQHGPLVIGFQGTYGTYIDDPNNKITGVVVQDPQRGDMRAETASRRPDKYRAPTFQTGHLLLMDEWLRDEWWLGFAYATVIKMPDGSVVNIERSDGVYPTPHWGGKFVLIVDDADAEWPSDKEGRVKFR